MTNVDETLAHARVFHYKLLNQYSNIVNSMTTKNLDKVDTRFRSLDFAIKKNLAYMQFLYEILIFNVQHADPTLKIITKDDGSKHLVVSMPLPENYKLPESLN